MKRFIKKILLLIIILTLVAAGINHLLSIRNVGQGNVKFHYRELFNSERCSECIILGTSHAVNGIRPSYIHLSDLSVYNFSLDGSNPEFYYHWYNRIFKKTYKKPQYIVFCIEWFLFDDQWLLRKYEHDSEFFPLSHFLNDALDVLNIDIPTLLFNRFPFFKYNKRSDLKYFIEDPGDSMYPLDEYDRGFIPYYSLGFGEHEIREEKISEKYETYFRMIIDQWINENIKIVFVHMPECHFNSIVDYKNMRSFKIFNEIASKYNIPILNYNLDHVSDINYNIKCYSDPGHMSSYGSREFSKMLNKDLNTLLFHSTGN